jgi:hypothetical protein
MRPALAGVVVLAVLAGGCRDDAVDAATEAPPRIGHEGPRAVGPDWQRLSLTFDRPAHAGRLVEEPVAVGDGLLLTEATIGSSHVVPTDGPDGGAAAFGTQAGTGTAALVVHPDDAALEPGGARLRLAADFRLAEPQTETAGANIVQRGLFDTGSQVKLQVDDGVTSCRVAGNSGSVVVEGASVDAGTWYRAVCERDRARVTLFVAELGASGPLAWRSWEQTGATGALRWPAGQDPLSVGAKVNSQGGIVVDAPDRFVGAIDNVRWEVEP